MTLRKRRPHIRTTYRPPSPDDLAALQKTLGFSGVQMAGLAAISEQHWRKYTTNTENSRSMALSTLFHMVARLELDDETLERIYDRMRVVGAEVSIEKVS